MGSRLGAIAMQALALILLGLGCATAQYSSCPEAYGLQLYPHEQYCDKFYKCANGTLYEEVCENGLVFDGHGAVHNHCNYNWPSTAGRGSTTTPPSPHLDVSTSLASTRLERDARQLSSSALLGSPMRLRATRVLPTTQRSTSATTLTRCHIVRNSRRVLLGLNAPRLMSFLQMLLPGASCLSPGSQCPAMRRLTSCAWPTTRGSTTVETTASLTHRPFLASTISPNT